MCVNVAVRMGDKNDVNTLGTSIGRLYYLNNFFEEIENNAQYLLKKAWESEFADLPQNESLTNTQIRQLFEDDILWEFITSDYRADSLCETLMCALLTSVTSSSKPSKKDLKKAIAKTTGFCLAQLTQELEEELNCKLHQMGAKYNSIKNQIEECKDETYRENELNKLNKHFKQLEQEIYDQYMVNCNPKHLTLDPTHSSFLKNVCQKLDNPNGLHLLNLLYQTSFFNYDTETIPEKFQENLLCARDFLGLFQWLNSNNQDFDNLDHEMHVKVEFDFCFVVFVCYCYILCLCFVFCSGLRTDQHTTFANPVWERLKFLWTSYLILKII